MSTSAQAIAMTYYSGGIERLEIEIDKAIEDAERAGIARAVEWVRNHWHEYDVCGPKLADALRAALGEE